MLLCGSLLLCSMAHAQEPVGFAPRPSPRVTFRADFRAAWNITDGVGMIDHFLGEVSLGPQVGVPGAPVRTGIAPLLAIAGGIAEDGEASLRILGGVEWAIGTPHPAIELVPGIFGGFLKQFARDRRQGPMLRVSMGVRFLGDDNFYIVVQPISFVLLPEPPGGFTPYTTHFAVDATMIRIGGRLPGGF